MIFAADTETCLIRRALKVPPLVCLAYQQVGKDKSAHVVRWDDAHDVLQTIFENESIWAFAAYDLPVICNQFPDLTDLVFDALDNDRVYDVLLRQQLIDIGKGRFRRFYVDPVTKSPIKIGYSLKDLVKRHLREDLEKKDTFRLKYHTVRNIPIEQWPKAAIEYAKLDVEPLFKIFDKQEEHAHMLKDQFRQVRADVALQLASAWGVRTDRKTVEEIDKRTEAEYKLLRKELEDLDLVRKGAGSRNTKLAKALLMEHLPFEQQKLTKTGYLKAVAEFTRREKLAEKNKQRFNEDVVEAEVKKHFIDQGYISLDEDSCESSGHPALIKYARYGSVIKLRSTFVNAMWGGVRKPLQPYYLVLVETGRTSCSSPNLQQCPREPGIRECVVPRDGHVFVGADYDKAELVSLAETCIEFVGYSRLGDRLIDGFDPHLDLGAQILGIPYAKAEEQKKLGGKLVGELSRKLDIPFKFPSKVDLPTGTDYFEAVWDHVCSTYGVKLSKIQLQILKDLDDTAWSRQMSKAGNFGFPGGLGPETFVEYAKKSYGVILTIEEAIELRRVWHQQWPEMRDYFRFINELLDGGEGYVIQPISERYRGGVTYTQCCNGFFQMRTADGAKAACWEVTKRQFTKPASALYGSHLVVFVHDELILETPEERAHEVGQELSRVMVEQFQRFHPNMKKAVKASPVAMRYWSKEAKPIYENGRLMPWGEKRLLAA